MDKLSQHLLLFILPLVLANTCHIVVVKKDWLSWLCIPIAPKAFGYNKTIRGFVVLPIFCWFWVLLFSLWKGPFTISTMNDVLIGLGLGVVYLLSELPNSFVKRRLGIANGEHSKRFKGLQMLVDKADSLVGMLIFYYFVVNITVIEVLQLFVLALMVSLLTSFILHTIQLKKSF